LIAVFLLGVVAGALALYYFLWRTGGLVAGHPLARTTVPLASVRGENALRPLPPDRTPSPITIAPAPLTPLSTPAPGPGETTAPSFTPLAGFALGHEPLVLPVEGARATDLHDSFEENRGSGRHEAIDILAPRGTPVVAAVDGSIEKLFTSKRGGLTIYEFDPDRNYCYYYAHLDRYAEDLKEKQTVRRGDRLGYVGSTGDASPAAPHLHFAIMRLGPAKQWWVGTPINPYPYLLATGKIGSAP
jgi:murein DD-endopeptidase MepM/ murein hydrolase activator NlpD